MNKVGIQTRLVLLRDQQILRKNYQFEIIQSDDFRQGILGFTFPMPLKKLVVSHRVKACSLKSSQHLSVDKPDAYPVTSINCLLLPFPVSKKTFQSCTSVLL